jgi:hypothetical protein
MQRNKKALLIAMITLGSLSMIVAPLMIAWNAGNSASQVAKRGQRSVGSDSLEAASSRARMTDNAALAAEAQCDGVTVSRSDWPIASGYLDGAINEVTQGEVIVWDRVQVNNGRHYDAERGVFTTPVPGIYELCATLQNPVYKQRAWARVRVDGEFIGPERWYANGEHTSTVRDCEVLAAQAGAEIDLMVVKRQYRCRQATCNFTIKLLAPAC